MQATRKKTETVAGEIQRVTAALWSARLIPVAVFVITFIAFLPALQNGFVMWDDDVNIVENPSYRGLGWPQLRWMLTTFHIGHYQPLSWMTLGLDYLLWGMNPSGYHLTSLLLHGAGAVLFYFICVRLFSAGLPAAGHSAVRWTAAFAALFFSIHPLRVESVAWATERRDVLSGLFLFATVAAYLRAVRGDTPRCHWWFGGAIVFYALSLLSKASGMTLPVVLLVLDVYPLKRLPGAPRQWTAKFFRPIWLEKIPFLLLAGAAAAVAVVAQSEAGALLAVETYGLGRRLGQAMYALVFYVWKTFVPMQLSPIYQIAVKADAWPWLFTLSTATVAVATALVVLTRRKFPVLLACWLCYLAFLAPVSGIAQSGMQAAADRYSYLACLSWAVLAGGACYMLGVKMRYRAGIAALFLLILLGAATRRQTSVWHDSATLWSHAVMVSPQSSIAHYNLALIFGRQREFDRALAEYKIALQLDPTDPDIHNNLGLLLATRGEIDDAAAHFREALRLDPRYARAYYNLGRVLLLQGRAGEATDYFNDALRLQPGVAEIHENLARALIQQGKKEEAMEQYEEAVKLMKAEPKYPLGQKKQP